jgi:glycosyltransferase involved in cell wall biosynthesis
MAPQNISNRTLGVQPATSTRSLLVADAPGHIISRIGRSWLRHGGGVEHELVSTAQASSFSICRRARELGMVHWLDQIGYQALGRAVRAPQVVMVHHLTDDGMAQRIAELDRCDAITTSSRLWQIRLENLTGRPAVLIPYSLDTRTFHPPADREAAKAAAGIGSGQFVVGFLGKAGANHANRKGLDVLEAALKSASDRRHNLCLLLVGPGWEPLAGRMRRAGVHVLQRQYKTTEETVAAYAVMDALLVTSSEEGGPCTILEAMACGVPVITSMVGHVREIVSDGRTGLVCSSRSPREYVERLDLLIGSPGIHQYIAGQARAFVTRERDDAVVIPRINFAALYNGALQRFQSRSCLERAIRILPSAYLYARSVARPILRMGSPA